MSDTNGLNAAVPATLYCLGVSHRTAPVDVLALAQFTDEARDAALATARRDVALERLVIVSTCNRVELYTVSPTLDVGTAREILTHYLTRGNETLAAALAPHVRFAAGVDAVRHLFHVAAGLDSLVIGEQQILAQISAALGIANAAHAASPALKRTFKAAVETGHRARTDAWQSAGATSISAVAADAATEASPVAGSDTHVVVIGAGMMARLAVKALRARGVAHITIANRTKARAESLAARYAATGVGLDDLATILHDAHAVIVAASAPTVLLTESTVAAARARGYIAGHDAPLTIVDIGMPRMVDVSVRTLDGVSLVDLDSIQTHIDRAVAGRNAVLADAEALVEHAVRDFLTQPLTESSRRPQPPRPAQTAAATTHAMRTSLPAAS